MSTGNGEPAFRFHNGQRWGAATAASLAIMLAAPGAWPTRANAKPADENPVRLRWHAPAECPTQGHVADRIAALRNKATTPTRAVVEATVTRHAGRFWLALVVESEHGVARRELSDGDCAVLAETAALLVAVATDSLVSAQAEPPAPSEPQPTSAGADPQADRSDPDVLSLEIGLGFQVNYGLVPGGPGAQVALGLQVRRRPWRFGVDAALVWPTEVDQTAYPDARLRFGAAMGRGRFCLDWALGPVAAGPCVVVEIGSLWSEVLGIDEPHPGHSLWLAGGATVELRADLARHLAVSIGAGAVLPRERARLEIETPAGWVELHRVGAVVGQATAALLLVF